MRNVDVIAGIRVRTLTSEQREQLFQKSYAKVDIEPYRAVIREMEGGMAYAIGLNGSSARSTRVRLSKAAKSLGLKLRYAKARPDAGEVVVELAP